jgi:type VI secretion system secreted protein Hcp
MAIYLSIEGIKGSVTAKGYNNYIDVFNYHNKSFRPITQRSASQSDRALGIHDRSSLKFTKNVDIASPSLLNKFYRSQYINKLTFHHVSSGSSPQCYLENTFHHVLLTAFEEFCSGDGATEEIEMIFTSQEKRVINIESNQTASSPQTVGYDYATMQSI